MKHVFLAVAAMLLGGLAQGQTPRSPAISTVSGIVFDSLALAPLDGAIVQLVNADSLANAAATAVSDSLGRFLFDSVPPGRYLLGFLHPIVDSLGIEPTPRELIVSGTSAIRMDLVIPSPRSLRIALCGATAVADSDAVIIGFARHASGRMAVDSAIISVQWTEFTLDAGRLTRSTARRAVATRETGWFGICGAPIGGTVLLNAAYGTDSTEALELEVPATGYLRRDLYFGTSRVATADSGAARSDSLADGPLRSGNGRVSGVVVAAVGGRPLAGARVSMVRGPQTRANDRGEWSLLAVPTGSRTLEVRAVGHYPISMPVDVIDGAGPVRVAMVTLQSVLDTVRVTAKRMGNGKLLEFLNRRRTSGSGRFLTSADIASRNPTFTTDLFRSIPGVSLARNRNGDETIVMRGNGLAAQCAVSVFLNGMSMRGMTANDINGFVRPNEVIGIEVYSAGATPAQFAEQNGCGSVVIWSR